MKLLLGSDLHLEFGFLKPLNTDKADVLVLSGDICVAREIKKFMRKEDGIGLDMGAQFVEFMNIASSEFENVVYVAGNHEFYHGKFFESLDVLKEMCASIEKKNVHFLENDSVKLGDHLFVGATLWSDMNKGDPTTYHVCQSMMNDYRIITHDKNGYTKLRPAHTHQRHRETLKYLEKTVDENQHEKIVIVGHHAPSKVSTKPEYEKDFHINGAYSSDLSEFILNNPQIKLWTHGHTHSNFDYMIGSTRIVCNPRGYVNYERGSQENDPYYFQLIELE